MTSPEASLSYLERSNFKALMEWLTARCILHRPDDPAVFCRDLLDRSIQLRRGGRDAPYDPNCAARLLKECYDDAMNSANEHGIIHLDACTASPIDKLNELPELSSVRTTSQNHDIVPGHDAALSSSPTAADQSTQLAEEGMSPAIEPTLLSALEDIFEVARPEVAASAVVAGVCKAVHARRAALFKVVDDAGTLREMGVGDVSDNQQRIVKSGQGLVGQAIAAQEPVPAVVVPFPSLEEAFCREVDLPRDPPEAERAPTSRVPPLMYGVLKNSDPSGGVWGVMVAAEPATDGDAFDTKTLNTFRVLCDMATVAIRNAEAFELGVRGCDKFRNMVEVMKATNDHLGVNPLLYTITKCLPKICDAEKCTCFLVDDSKNELWAVQGELNIRMPKDKGIVGAVATSGNVENISDVYADPRFNKEVDVETGFQTQSILAMPVRGGEDNRVIAVVQLINKQGPGDPTLNKSCESAGGKNFFTAQDTAVIGSFLSLLGPHIFNSTMVKFKKNSKSDGDQEAFPDRSTGAVKKTTGSVSNFLDARHTVAEEEEEEYDDSYSDCD